MAFIQTLPDDGATGQAADLYAEHVAALGYVPNYLQLLALRPNVYGAWRQLVKSIVADMGLHRYELATFAAARALRSTYCATEHGKVLRDRFYDADTVRRIAMDHRSAGIEPAESAIMDFADKVARDAASIVPEDIERLRVLDLTELEILDVALAAAARCFFSTLLHAMGVGPDAATLLALEAPLREALAGSAGSLTC